MKISTKITILVFGAVMAVALFAGMYVGRGSTDILLGKAMEQLQYEARIKGEKLVAPIKILREDIELIHGMPVIEEILKTYQRRGSVEILKDQIGKTFAEVLRVKPRYRSIEFLHFGEEAAEVLVRVSFFGNTVKVQTGHMETDQAELFQAKGLIKGLIKSEAEPLAPGQIFLSQVESNLGEVSLERKEVLVIAALGVFDKGSLFGCVTITMDLRKDLNDLIRGTSENLTPFVSDLKGRILASDGAPQKPAIQDLYPQVQPYLAGISREKGVTLHLKSNRRQEHRVQFLQYSQAHYDPLRPERFLAVSLVASQERLLGASADLRNRGLLVVLGLGVLCAIASVILANRITTPLTEIMHAIEKFALGDKNVDLPLQSKDEIGILARTFQNMVEQVRIRNRELVQSEEKFRIIFERAHDGVITVSEDHKIQTFNPAAEALFGYAASEVIGQDLGLLMDDEIRLKHPERILKFLESGRSGARVGVNSDVLGKRKDGSLFPMLLSISVINVGDTVMLAGIVRDVSEKKKIEDSLKKSESQLRLFVKHTPASIAMFDTEIRYLMASDKWIRDYHLESHEYIGKSHYELFPETSDKWKQVHRLCVAGKVTTCDEDQISTKEGVLEWIKWEVHPWYIDETHVGGIILFTEVITDRKKAEIELHELHDRLVESSRKAGMAEVANSILHNVGNVLNSVNVSVGILPDYVESLEIKKLNQAAHVIAEQSDLHHFLTQDERGRHFSEYFSHLTRNMVGSEIKILEELTSLKSNIEHMGGIIDLQQSYAGSSGFEEILSINELVEDALRMVGGSLKKRGINLVKELEEIPTMLLDKHKVLQILVNLVQNAKEALVDVKGLDKEIRIRTDRLTDRVRVEVIDNGLGIAEEDLKNIFQLGFTTKVDGHGFGLHNCALAAEEMGAELVCYSTGVGRGATFVLEIPIKEVEKMAS